MDFPRNLDDFESSSTASPTTFDGTDFTYEDYIPTTIDPDWWFTFLIIGGCLVLHLTLPLWIYVGRRMGFHQSDDDSRMSSVWKISHQNNDTSKDNDILLKQLDDARSVVSGYVDHDDVYSRSGHSRSGRSMARSHVGSDLRGGDTGSVVSGFKDAVLQARPKRTPQKRQHTSRRIVSSASSYGDIDDRAVSSGGKKKKLDVRMAAEYKKAEQELAKSKSTGKLGATITYSIASSDAFDDRSEIAPSVMSNLDADAISVKDAVDARDGASQMFDDSSHQKRIYPETYWTSKFNNLLEIVAFDYEMKKFTKLAGHYTFQSIVSDILGIVEIAAMGRYLGVKAVGAYIVVDTVTGFTGCITTGFYECTGILIPQANGARNNLLVGRYMQLGIIFYLITALPSAVFWSFYVDDAVRWYQFDDATAEIALKYFWATLPGYVTYGIDAVLYEFLNTMGHQKYVSWFTIVSEPLYTGVFVALLHLGFTELYYIGILETFSGIVCLVINVGLMLRNGWLEQYWEGLVQTNGLKDRRAVSITVNTALPLSFAWVLTYGEWEIMSLFCRSMGNTGAEVTAWGLIGYIWSAFETLTDGWGDAAEVRVGFRMGAGQVRLAKKATWKALYVALSAALYSTGILFVLAMYAPGWLTPDKTLQKMIFDVIPLIGFGQIWMVWGMVAWAVLGAQGRVRTATILEFFISWGIGAPIAAIFVFVFNYNIEGIIGGLTISYTLGTNVYLYMLFTSDWEYLSADVVAKNAAKGKTYDEFDWGNLPTNIQEAAIELGYNEEIWEGQGADPESNNKSWHRLTNRERKAALVLGYSEATWDGNDEMKRESFSEDNESWAKLSKEAQNAARVLGYNQAIWDNDGSPPTEDMDWNELSRKEQEAAITLGYTKEKWNGDDDDDDSSSFSYKTPNSSGPIRTRSNSSDYGTAVSRDPASDPDQFHSEEPSSMNTLPITSGDSVFDQIKNCFT